MGIISNLLGAGQDKLLKSYRKEVDKITAMEPEIQAMSGDELAAEIQKIRMAYDSGEAKPGTYTNRLLALCREVIWRNSGKRAYDVQLIAALALNDGHIAEAKTGEGKACTLDTPIPTPQGWKLAGEITEGEFIFSPDGQPTKVIGVFPQGEQEIYEVELKDGRVLKVAAEHLWSVYDGYITDELVTLNTEELYNNAYANGKQQRGYKYHLPVTQPVHYEQTPLSLDPYAMGLMLGDGTRNQNGTFILSCSDEDIANVESLSQAIHAVQYSKASEYNHSWIFYSEFNAPGRGNGNICVKIADICPEYKELLSQKYCYEKWIPVEYRTASIEQRWALIQGLMDSDGNIYAGDEGRYNMQFSTTSPQLRDDFMEVLYSLGLSCSYRVSRKAGEHTAKHDQYTVKIHVPNSMKPNFFRLQRKKDIALEAAKSAPKKKDYSKIAIVDIRKTGRFADQVCFAVDHPSHLFLAGNYIVTHNTIMSNFPSFVNAIEGKQVHVVTVNEYLAKRDSEICAKSLRGTGITVGYIYNQQPADSKKKAYACDIVYGTPSEFGFDYLRDNMVNRADNKVQTHHDYAIIDEIDSILIDEARTPLIISGAGTKDVKIYTDFARAVMGLKEGIHFDMDEAKKTISATEEGLTKVEQFLGLDDLYEDTTQQYPRYLKQALTAQFLYHKDKDYIIDNGEVKIVDPNTGRVMEGRRWSEGLHQAIEAKEHVKIQQENDTLATVTLQNFFRLYDKLSGMTGTAMTEDAEFRKTYGMGVVAVPPNKPVIRQDMNDVVYKSVEAKFNAIADKIEECHHRKQPVLVGTVSVENSEKLSRLLKKRGIKHETLNAKNHEHEAHIIAQAGRAGAVTIATNMAGRGTDIILGGNPEEMLETLKRSIIMSRPVDPETGQRDTFIPQADLDEAMRQINEICDNEREIVLNAGGLAVLGSERHEARRIDNQLRGRAGRQGDPGYSQFYISLEDDLMRLFGQDRMEAIKNFMDRADIPDDMPIDAAMVSKAIERAQRQVESMHYEMRKHTLEYDDVLNKQRLAIYSERDMLLSSGDVSSKLDWVEIDVANDLASQYCDDSLQPSEWDYDKLKAAYEYLTGTEDADFIGRGKPGMDFSQDVADTILEHIKQDYKEKSEAIGEELMSQITKQVMLNSVDAAWKEHLTYMDFLKSNIGLRSYGQRDPLVEYKDEAYKAFEYMVDSMYQTALTSIMRLAIVRQEQAENPQEANPASRFRPPVRARIDFKQNHIAIPANQVPTGGEPLDQKEDAVAASAGLGNAKGRVNMGMGDAAPKKTQ